VWSCRTAGESFDLSSIVLLLLSPRAKTTEHLAGFLLFGQTVLHTIASTYMGGVEGNIGQRIPRMCLADLNGYCTSYWASGETNQ